MKPSRKTIVKLMTAVVIIVIIAMLMMFDPIAQKVGGAIGVLPDKLKYWGGVASALGIGVLLIITGVASLTVPILGTAMILVGLALLAYYLYPLLKGSSSNSKM